MLLLANGVPEAVVVVVVELVVVVVVVVAGQLVQAVLKVAIPETLGSLIVAVLEFVPNLTKIEIPAASNANSSHCIVVAAQKEPPVNTTLVIVNPA